MTAQRILVVDDKDTMRSLFQRILKEHDVVTADNGAKALALLGTEQPFDVIVSDIRMPKLDGLSLLKEVKRVHPDVEVILMTAFAEVGDAVDAMKAGASDYLVKPFDPDEAVLVVEKALEVQRLRSRARRLQQELELAHGFGPFVGTSVPMQRVYALVDKAAASEVNIIILGESGTGKELVARSIHDRGQRRQKPFVPVNCGALPLELAESELFGHVKGAFTGAISNKPGLVEEAGGGTLFLDEINSFPQALQVKLNRMIEEREARRVGANKAYRIDARIIAATNVDLPGEVTEGRFREDLYFRLNVLMIRLPPLRERREDIPVLAIHFFNQIDAAHGLQGFAPGALKALLAYPWPGNVRELRNAVESAVIIAEGDQINSEDLPAHIPAASLEQVPEEYLSTLTYQEACDLARERMLHQYLRALMTTFHGNVTSAAERAGVERETLHRLLRKYSVTPSTFRS